MPLIKSFGLLCNKIDLRRFIDLAADLEKIFELEKERFHEKDILAEKSKNLLYIRRITITPTRTLFQAPELNTSNRVLRKFNPDNFVRVSFRDEDYGPLNLNWEYDTGMKNSIIKRIWELFHNGIQVGDRGRSFKFLGCSNSQLRSAGAWFVYEDGEVTVKFIRQWVGDFTQERSLSKYVSRLGLAFTTTESLLIKDTDEKLIDDIKTPDGKYTFSDGVGKISTPIAKQIMEEREMDYLPSAFQIRYGGCKGMVAIDPTLGRGDDPTDPATKSVIQIRPSMRKFESNHKEIEYIKASKPSLLYMNRQVIWLLRGYDVPTKEFVNLQNDTLLELANSLIYPEQASKSLMNYQGDGIFRQVLDAGIDLTKEPFHRRQLLSLYNYHVKEVLTRTRIVMPDKFGRQMYGVMDETGKLDYGEAFIQYSSDIAVPGKNKIILKGKLFITKNPCVHPGDLRTFTAKDVPALAHLCDVVVFPSRGPRPHPNELSGSDLDGDEYFVCWDPNLLPRADNHEAGEYECGETAKQDSPITPEQVLDQVVQHITKPNNLGKISNAHTVHCDKDSALCALAIRLAHEHSVAVDYPKTGIPEDFSRELRVFEYPDWMEKPDKPCYRSTSVVGDCYRICRSLDHVLGEQDVFAVDPNSIKADDIFMIEGLQVYLGKGIEYCNEYNKELFLLMSQYGIENEGDIACGCLNTVKQSLDKDRKKNYDITEECIRFYRTLQSKYKKMFFEEFKTKKGEWMEEDDTKSECFKKACSWYYAAYHYAQAGATRLLSFPWCVSEVLCEYVRIKKPGMSSSLPPPMSCTQELATNMNKWLIEDLPKLREQPPESYTKALSMMEQFEEYFSLLAIESRCIGLPFNQNQLVYYCPPDGANPLASLQQEMFEKYPGWDKSHLEVLGQREIYLALRANPKVCVLSGLATLRELFTIRQYLDAYPTLVLPSAVIVKWVDANSLDSEFHVLSTDFILLFILILIMERKIEPIDVKYPSKESATADFYLDQLSTPLKTPDVDKSTSVDLYFLFLRSLIYSKAGQNLQPFSWVPPSLKDMIKSICSQINANSTKAVSYAMREYHETCYFLFNKNEELTRKRGKRNKIAKYKPDFVYPICYDAELCARHLQSLSSLEVNMRRSAMARDEIIVIEVWGRTPEVLQEVTESMQIPQRDPTLGPLSKPLFIRNQRCGNVVKVEGSHRILIGGPVKNKDTSVMYEYANREGYRAIQIFQVLCLPSWDSAKKSAQGFLMDRANRIRESHNMYAHGTLSASCEFGRFLPFLNCTEMDNKRHQCSGGGFNSNNTNSRVLYVNTLTAVTQENEHNRFLSALKELGFKKGTLFYRFRLKLVREGVPVTLHLSHSDDKFILEKLSWADMEWCELHLFNERHEASDRHSHRDLILNISSRASLNAEELRLTKGWRNIESELQTWLQFIPPYSNKIGQAVFTEAARKEANKEGLFWEVTTEQVDPFCQDSTWKKVKFDIITRIAFSMNCKFDILFGRRKQNTGAGGQNNAKEGEALVRPDPETYHIIAQLPQFDALSIGLLNEFFDTCTKLR